MPPASRIAFGFSTLMFGAVSIVWRESDLWRRPLAGGFKNDADFTYHASDRSEAPTLSFMIDTKSYGPALTEATARTLEGGIQELAERGLIAQAVIGRWEGTSRARSAYEAACGIPDGVSRLAAWRERYMRGLGDVMWLGPPLVERLGDRLALERLADVEPAGDGLRVRLRDGEDRGDLERALAPILAGDRELDAFLRERGRR